MEKMDLERFIELASQLNGMGWSVVQQLEDVVGGEGLEEQNDNALEMILDFLRECGDDVEVETLHDRIEAHLNK